MSFLADPVINLVFGILWTLGALAYFIARINPGVNFGAFLMVIIAVKDIQLWVERS